MDVVIENVEEDMGECCVYDELGFNNWSSEIVYLNVLKNSSVAYLAQLGVIPRFNQGSCDITECDLILNRLSRIVDIEKPYLKICPLHRYTFGIGWKIVNQCAHLDHRDSFDATEPRGKRKKSSKKRILPFHLVRHVAQFPYGGRICGMHLQGIYLTVKEQQLVADDLNTLSDIHSYEMKVEKNSRLENINTLLISLEESPLKSQITVPLEEQAPSSLRRLTAKLRKIVSVAATNAAEGIAPGEGEKLLQLADLEEVICDRRSSNVLISSNSPIDEQHLAYLVKMYHSYEERNLPFNEQVRVLTLIPKSWKLSSPFIEEKFNCSNYAVKTARQLSDITDLPLHIEKKSPNIRQYLNPEKIDYFLSWIIESNLLVSIPWGSTNLKLENGEQFSIPRQVLQAQHSQIIYLYKQHCSIVGIDSMSERTIYSVLESIHANQSKAVTGLDQFVATASEGWTILKNIIQKLQIPRQKKHDMNIMLENNKLYLKSKYASHCSEHEQTKTHCTIYALSQENNSFYSQACNHAHDLFCEDCILIAELFDEIEDSINEIIDEEIKDELLYDLELVWDSIFQLMAHRIRAVQQEQQKKKYINAMDATTAFLTVDWSQKILPQWFREGQSSYFGKRGMSLLVGSFAFKKPSENETISKTYMLALTTCSQTEYETLCCAQLILERFHYDYPHIDKLIKRSDNASVLAGQNTIQCEKTFAESLGIKLLIRDYSEVQSGKSVCDRMSGSGKVLSKGYNNSGNNILNAFDIKKAFEYAGGIQNLMIGVAEVLEIPKQLPINRIPELCSIRNVIYNDTNIRLRKASGVGIGKPIKYENYQISNNVILVNSFDKYESYQSPPTSTTNKKRTDRMLKTFVFCPTECCTDTFESEEELNVHILLNQHTIKKSSYRTKDIAKLMLFEKIKNDSTSSLILPSTSPTTSSTHIPRHYKVFSVQGWALRTRKKVKPIDKSVKEFIKTIFEEEKLYGRKTPNEEYLTRIRTARNTDGTKKFNPKQYLTCTQIQTQIKSLAKLLKTKTTDNTQPTTDNTRTKTNLSTQTKKQNINETSFTYETDDTSSDEEQEDQRAIQQAEQLENLKQAILKNNT
ncbi:unnamed protein product [Adineta steineri]|uniref:C2H2-type domain-containing protein n=1 Tax=Adineta steineri TaxID=433720 RepID=A0A819SCV4_9BILA|nr:unnamed protein product [Adineta steineri]CAF4068195.1 unnamed protein product [Adineta steineri]